MHIQYLSNPSYVYIYIYLFIYSKLKVMKNPTKNRNKFKNMNTKIYLNFYKQYICNVSIMINCCFNNFKAV
jgi:hypothetical protein